MELAPCFEIRVVHQNHEDEKNPSGFFECSSPNVRHYLSSPITTQLLYLLPVSGCHLCDFPGTGQPEKLVLRGINALLPISPVHRERHLNNSKQPGKTPLLRS